ncbi:32-trans-enoyl-CoA isomerase mitochondrial precursor [Perkinsela sp. CCAP 1560/4]|nr:32-trans-enoyl-CoA isomerase mitochondrial precursor [Perkinsela sp. CCAP 1560/4]|eukprot:KNH05452.1 32-trans-enoyl-CoA isomerase mitochondrial precursor [Perkinsela sp. CCAP 1560/4]
MFRRNIGKYLNDHATLNVLQKITPAPGNLPLSPCFELKSMHKILLCIMKEHFPETTNACTVDARWHNFLTTRLLKDMCRLFAEVEKDNSIQGIILTADRHGNPSDARFEKAPDSVDPRPVVGDAPVFSEGIDCRWMAKANTDSFEEFWFHMQELWIVMHLMRKPVIACIEGNAIGMGCALALACDLRVAQVEKMDLHDPPKTGCLAQGVFPQGEQAWKIGLNEVRYGFVPPPWITSTLGYLIGHRPAEKLIQTGALITPSHAHSIGLIDLLVRRDTVNTALAHMHNMLSVPSYGRATAKAMLRRELLSTLLTADDRMHDITHFSTFRRSDTFRKGLRNYLDCVDESTQLLPSESRGDSWDPFSKESMGETVRRTISHMPSDAIEVNASGATVES